MSEVVETIARALCVVGDDPEIYWKDYVEEATAAITALEANGWAVVPREPTRRQLEAAEHVPPLFTPSDTYRAMINATTTEEI